MRLSSRVAGRLASISALASVPSLSCAPTVAGQTCGPAAWSIVGPESREGLTWCYDAARANFVVYGGYGAGGSLADTWTLDATSWTSHPTNPLGTRVSVPMIYDSLRGRTILYGGTCSNRETWSWDGSSWSRLATDGPSVDWLFAMTYDAARDRVVLYGGQGCGGQEQSETWEWNGTSWSQLPTPGPGPRINSVMAYDPIEQRVMLYGGTDVGPFITTYYTDTWAWNGTAWTQLAPSGPAGSSRPGMAFDTVRNRMILFSGRFAGSSSSVDGTWEWTGSGWEAVTLTTSPAPRFAVGLATDTTSGRVVLFGGRPDNGYARDVWRLDDTTWTRIVQSPVPRSAPAMVYDRARGETIMFGGSTANEYTSETWIWDGQDWELRTTPSPTGRDSAAMAYDSIRQLTVLFGGRGIGGGALGDTWEWNGSTWTHVPLSGPPARWNHSATFDQTNKELLLYGGNTGSTQFYDTWVYEGTAWTRAATVGPGGNRRLNPLVYDPVRRQVITFGGELLPAGVRPSDTWAWDGSAWIQLPITGPAGRINHRLVYDRDLRRIIMLGGGREVWTLSSTGSAWVRLSDSIEPVDGNVSAFDEARSNVVCTGGSSARAISNLLLFTDHRAPTFTSAPEVTSTCAGRLTRLSVEVTGTSPLTYSWRRDGVALDPSANPSAATPELELDPLTLNHQGVYECVTTNACGAATSDPTSLSICQADLNCDGLTDFADYLEFLNLFETGDARADFDQDGLVDFSDYLEFLNLFDAGC